MSVVSPNDWKGSIAARSSLDLSKVDEILKKHSVVPSAMLPRQRSLVLRSVRLKGVKHGADQPFEFSWRPLGPGLWALLTDENGRGKSSVLGLVRGALQGRFPGTRVKSDVWAWLEELDIAFTIDTAEYGVSLRKPRGECGDTDMIARLTRNSGGVEVPIVEGPADANFATGVEALFMEEFGFSKFHAFRARQAEAAEHGWNSMSAALFITGPGEALFGDVTSDALPLRLIQLFIGLPWVTTYTVASAALKKVEAEREREPDGVADKVASRIAELDREISALMGKLKDQPDVATVRASLRGLDRALVERRREAEGAAETLALCEAELREAKSVRAEVRRRLLQARENAAAGLVFRRLQPAHCPACASAFEDGRFSAADIDTCGLCGRPDPGTDDDGMARVAELEMADADALKALKASQKALEAAREKAEAASWNLAGAKTAIAKAQDELLAGSAADALRADLEKLRARQDELRMMASPASSPSASDEEMAVLRAAEAVTKELFDGLQREVLEQVSASLIRHCRDFGVPNLESMALQGNGALRIRQGGVNQSFGGLNPGERLRVRIALALAVLEVSKVRGHGRHPGLIVLDSPGAQEMSDHDFAALIGSVINAADRFGDIQIIVGAVNRHELESRVPPDRRRHAKGAEPLF